MQPVASDRRVPLDQALLVCAGLATLIATECVWLSRWLEGSHQVTLLRAGHNLSSLWLRYVAAFAISGALGWGLGWLFGLRSRFGTLFLVLLACMAPVLNGLLATRSAAAALAATPIGGLVGGALAVILAVWLVRAAHPQRWLASRLSLAGLLCAFPVVTALNLLAWLRPSDFTDLRGILQTAGLCAAWAVSAAPLVWALLPRDAGGRDRRMLVAVAGYAALLLLSVHAYPARTRQQVPPRVDAAAYPPILMIVVDTLRADAVWGFGPNPDATPHLRALAEDATRFTRAYAAAPWTTPSFASLLTSSYPSEHQAGRRDPQLGFRRSLSESVATLPGVLAQSGYWTGAALTNGYLGARFGLGRDFDVYENLRAAEWGHPVLVGLATRGFFDIPAYVKAAEQTDRILELVRRGAGSGRPFFVLAHYMDPHAPNDPASLPADGSGSSVTAAYRAEVEYTDHHIGILMRELRAMGLYDRMLIVVTADHGEELAEQRAAGDYGHGHTLFDEVLRVPLLVKQPANRGAGASREEAVSLIDVAPTVLRLAGLDPPSGFRGIPLLGEGARPFASRVLFSERLLHGSEAKAGIRDDEKVILLDAESDAAHARAYDLGKDPGETLPLEASTPRFEPLLDALVRFAQGDSGAVETARVELDELERRRLEALGYVQ